MSELIDGGDNVIVIQSKLSPVQELSKKAKSCRTRLPEKAFLFFLYPCPSSEHGIQKSLYSVECPLVTCIEYPCVASPLHPSQVIGSKDLKALGARISPEKLTPNIFRGHKQICHAKIFLMLTMHDIKSILWNLNRKDFMV